MQYAPLRVPRDVTLSEDSEDGCEEVSERPHTDEEAPESEEDDDQTQMIAQAQETPAQYKFAEDVYGNAFVALLKPSEGLVFAKGIRIAIALALMLVVWAMQVALTHAVWLSANAKDQAYINTFRDIWYATSRLPTRIDPADAEEVCGRYRKEPDTESGAYIYQASPAVWWDDPSAWPTDGMSLLHETVYGLYIMDARRVPLYCYLIAIMSWTAAILLEMKDVVMFMIALVSLQPKEKGVHFTVATDAGVELKCLSKRYKLAAVMIAAMRLAVAVYLFITGCVFLRTDLAIENLILNAVALGFVLEVDALLYKGINLFSNSLFSSILTIQVKTCAQFEHVCAPVCGAAMVFFLVGAAFVNFISLKALLLARFSSYSSICLWMGPTPDIAKTFNVVFPVPVFCEALVCAEVAEAHCLPDDGEPANHYVIMLQKQCRHMLQVNATNPSLYKTRMSDEDLASTGITDDAAEFWCPTKFVKSTMQFDKLAEAYEICGGDGSLDAGFCMEPKFVEFSQRWEVMHRDVRLECQQQLVPGEEAEKLFSDPEQGEEEEEEEEEEA